MVHGKWNSGGKCPFTLKDSTTERFSRFQQNYPQFAHLVPTQQVLTVIDRKRILKACQTEWRNSRKRRKMEYEHAIMIKEGDIFQNAFSPASWNAQLNFTKGLGTEKIIFPTDSPNPEPSSSFNLTNNVPSLSTGVFRNLKLKMQYRVFGQEKSLFDLDKAVWDEDAEIFFINYAKTVNDLF